MNPSRIVVVALLVLVLGCESTPAADGQMDDQAGSGAAGAAGTAGTVAGGAGVGASGGAAGTAGTAATGGEVAPDAGMAPNEMADAGNVPGVGLSAESCCEEHAEPGCLDGITQECVCDKLPECCTDKWDAPCVLIVAQKFCDEGVRECVCGDTWQQNQCCESGWDDFCQTVAESKCEASPGC